MCSANKHPPSIPSINLSDILDSPSNMDLIVDFPHNRATPQNKPRVSFADIEIKFVENISCSKHRDDLWFSAEEMHSFKYQTAITVRTITSTMTMAQKAELHVKDTSAFLGLENYLTKNTLQEMKYRRKAAPMAVLSEQHRQDRLGINDPDALASASQAVSDMSTRRARIIGMMHAER